MADQGSQPADQVASTMGCCVFRDVTGEHCQDDVTQTWCDQHNGRFFPGERCDAQ